MYNVKRPKVLGPLQNCFSCIEIMLIRLELVAFRIVVNMEWELECMVTRPRQLLVI